MIPTRITRLSAAIRYRNAARDGRADPAGDAGAAASCRCLTGPSSARTPSEISNASANTIVEWPEREPEPDAQRPLALAHQLAGRVVDRRDVVGVERVAHPERVRGDPDPDRERPRRTEAVVVGNDEREQHREPEHVQPGDRREHQHQRPPLAALQTRPEADRPSERSASTATYKYPDATASKWHYGVT